MATITARDFNRDVLLVPSVYGSAEVSPLADALAQRGITSSIVTAVDDLRAIAPTTVITVMDEWMRDAGTAGAAIGVEYGCVSAARAVTNGLVDQAILIDPPVEELRLRPEFADRLSIDVDRLTDQAERLTPYEDAYNSGQWTEAVIEVATFAYDGDPAHRALAAAAKAGLTRRLPLDVSDVRGDPHTIEWLDNWRNNPRISIWLTAARADLAGILNSESAIVQPWPELVWLSHPDKVADAILRVTTS